MVKVWILLITFIIGIIVFAYVHPCPACDNGKKPCRCKGDNIFSKK